MVRTKRLAAAAALLLALIMLFSALYIAFEADHDCCGEGCAVCSHIRACRELLRDLLAAAAVMAAVSGFYAVTATVADECCSGIRPHTLIALKVKLSN